MRTARNWGFFALCVALGGCSSSKTETMPDNAEITEEAVETESEEQVDVAAVYQRGVDNYSQGTMNAEAFTPDAQLVTPAGTVDGNEAIVKTMLEFRAPFPDMQVKSERLFSVSDDFIIVQGVSNGTHTVAMGELAATNKKVGNGYLHLLWFDGDKIKRVELMSNPMTTMMQVGAVPAPKGQAPAPPAMPASTEMIEGEANPANEAIAKAYFEAVTNNDGEALAAMVTPEFEIVHHGMNATMNLQQAGEHMASLGKGLTEMSLVPEKMYSVGDWVIVRAPFKAKHTGELMGMKATNKVVTTPTYHIMKIVDGKIAHNTEYVNIAHFAGQMKPPAQSAAK